MDEAGLKAGFELFNSGELERWLETLADEVVLTLRPESAGQRVYRGREQIREVAETLRAIDFEGVLLDSRRVRADLWITRQRGNARFEGTGSLVEGEFFLLLRYDENDLCVEGHAFTSLAEAEVAAVTL